MARDVNSQTTADLADPETVLNPYDGSRGPAWRLFKRDFLAKARGKFSRDDQNSWHACFLKIDQGGTGVGAPAAVGTADGQRKQAVRRGQAFDWLYSFISCDDLRQLLSDLAETNPADGLAGAAWDLLLAECEEADDDLEHDERHLLQVKGVHKLAHHCSAL